MFIVCTLLFHLKFIHRLGDQEKATWNISVPDLILKLQEYCTVNKGLAFYLVIFFKKNKKIPTWFSPQSNVWKNERKGKNFNVFLLKISTHVFYFIFLKKSNLLTHKSWSRLYSSIIPVVFQTTTLRYVVFNIQNSPASILKLWSLKKILIYPNNPCKIHTAFLTKIIQPPVEEL